MIGEGKWFRMWYGDKLAMLETMIKNRRSDFENGYRVFGSPMRKSAHEFASYQCEFVNQVEALLSMNPQVREHWCYADLVMRGVISSEE